MTISIFQMEAFFCKHFSDGKTESGTGSDCLDPTGELGLGPVPGPLLPSLACTLYLQAQAAF